MNHFIYDKWIHEWWIIGFLLLIFSIWIILKKSSQNQSANNREKEALESLKKRYASGKIVKREYEQRKKMVLQNKGVFE